MRVYLASILALLAIVSVANEPLPEHWDGEGRLRRRSASVAPDGLWRYRAEMLERHGPRVVIAPYVKDIHGILVPLEFDGLAIRPRARNSDYHVSIHVSKEALTTPNRVILGVGSERDLLYPGTEYVCRIRKSNREYNGTFILPRRISGCLRLNVVVQRSNYRYGGTTTTPKQYPFLRNGTTIKDMVPHKVLLILILVPMAGIAILAMYNAKRREKNWALSLLKWGGLGVMLVLGLNRVVGNLWFWGLMCVLLTILSFKVSFVTRIWSIHLFRAAIAGFFLGWVFSPPAHQVLNYGRTALRLDPWGSVFIGTAVYLVSTAGALIRDIGEKRERFLMPQFCLACILIIPTGNWFAAGFVDTYRCLHDEKDGLVAYALNSRPGCENKPPLHTGSLLWYATRLNRPDQVEALLRERQDLDSKAGRDSALVVAVGRNDERLLRTLLPFASSNVRNHAILEATQEQNPICLEIMLKSDNPIHKNGGLRKPLKRAVRGLDSDCAKILLKYGADARVFDDLISHADRDKSPYSRARSYRRMKAELVPSGVGLGEP